MPDMYQTPPLDREAAAAALGLIDDMVPRAFQPTIRAGLDGDRVTLYLSDPHHHIMTALALRRLGAVEITAVADLLDDAVSLGLPALRRWLAAPVAREAAA